MKTRNFLKELQSIFKKRNVLNLREQTDIYYWNERNAKHSDQQ
jgi:hypothetical protein